MKRLVLTIDDGPTEITPTIVDYLFSKSITAIMFFIGKNIESNYKEADYAIKNGFLIGNHSFNHKAFSTLSLEDCKTEILETDRIIEDLYKSAGIRRQKKCFRFPFGDKGGEHYKDLQAYLKSLHYENLFSPEITYPWYATSNLQSDNDVFWTFDYKDFLLPDPHANFTLESIQQRIKDKEPTQGGSLQNMNTGEIIIMHDHTWSNDVYKNYFSFCIEKTLAQGVVFIKPDKYY